MSWKKTVYRSGIHWMHFCHEEIEFRANDIDCKYIVIVAIVSKEDWPLWQGWSIFLVWCCKKVLDGIIMQVLFLYCGGNYV